MLFAVNQKVYFNNMKIVHWTANIKISIFIMNKSYYSILLFKNYLIFINNYLLNKFVNKIQMKYTFFDHFLHVY